MQVQDGLDPRCFAKVKLEPTGALPYVSRRALKRVRDWIKPPTHCHSCGEPGVVLVGNEVVYSRPYGAWPYCYLCPHCNAYVSLHPDTDLPQGFMADSFTRDARKAAKLPFQCICRIKFERTREAFDVKLGKMVKFKEIDRNSAYAWLSKATGIDRKFCHFAMFDEDVARYVHEVCYSYIFEEC